MLLCSKTTTLVKQDSLGLPVLRKISVTVAAPLTVEDVCRLGRWFSTI